MQLTTKKLESLIQEMIEDGYNREQKRKILEIIKKTRHDLIELQIVQGFFPTIINGIYHYQDKIEDIHKAIRNSVRVSYTKKAIMGHYRAIKNSRNFGRSKPIYFLIGNFEIEGNIAFIAKA